MNNLIWNFFFQFSVHFFRFCSLHVQLVCVCVLNFAYFVFILFMFFLNDFSLFLSLIHFHFTFNLIVFFFSFISKRKFVFSSFFLCFLLRQHLIQYRFLFLFFFKSLIIHLFHLLKLRITNLRLKKIDYPSV